MISFSNNTLALIPMIGTKTAKARVMKMTQAVRPLRASFRVPTVNTAHIPALKGHVHAEAGDKVPNMVIKEQPLAVLKNTHLFRSGRLCDGVEAARLSGKDDYAHQKPKENNHALERIRGGHPPYNLPEQRWR